MGNNKFKFSDMIPNAWFYKLKDMSKSSRKRNGSSHFVKNTAITSPTSTSQRSQHSRYSSQYFSHEPIRVGKLFNKPNHTKDLNFPFHDSPRMSSMRRVGRKTIYKPSHSSQPFEQVQVQVQSQEHDLSSIETSSCESYHNQCVSSESEFCDSFSVPDLLNCSCRVSSSTNDIIIDMNNESFQGNSKHLDGFESFDAFSQLGLAPILTKQVKFDDDDKIVKEIESRCSTESDERKVEHSFSSIKINQRRRKKGQIGKRASPNSSQGVRLRVNSPKLVNRKTQASGRKSVSRNDGGCVDGFAVVKSSMDPISDFKESMVEMIVENNIRGSKDLENLLACYLSLNSSEYHDLIVKAFEQIWYDMAQLRM